MTPTKPEDVLVELCAKLRRTEWVSTRERGGAFPINPDGPAAADAITTLLERLREALVAIERTAFVGATSDDAKQVALESIEGIARAALTGDGV